MYASLKKKEELNRPTSFSVRRFERPENGRKIESFLEYGTLNKADIWTCRPTNPDNSGHVIISFTFSRTTGDPWGTRLHRPSRQADLSGPDMALRPRR